MLKLDNVNKFFNRRKQNEIHVIKNVSLDMESSGLVALLGPSGCGKTTLLNVIGGLDKVNGGKVYVNGQQLTGLSLIHIYTLPQRRWKARHVLQGFGSDELRSGNPYSCLLYTSRCV